MSIVGKKMDLIHTISLVDQIVRLDGMMKMVCVFVSDTTFSEISQPTKHH